MSEAMTTRNGRTEPPDGDFSSSVCALARAFHSRSVWRPADLPTDVTREVARRLGRVEPPTCSVRRLHIAVGSLQYNRPVGAGWSITQPSGDRTCRWCVGVCQGAVIPGGGGWFPHSVDS